MTESYIKSLEKINEELSLKLTNTTNELEHLKAEYDDMGMGHIIGRLYEVNLIGRKMYISSVAQVHNAALSNQAIYDHCTIQLNCGRQTGLTTGAIKFALRKFPVDDIMYMSHAANMDVNIEKRYNIKRKNTGSQRTYSCIILDGFNEKHRMATARLSDMINDIHTSIIIKILL
jgi:hypothetical protein